MMICSSGPPARGPRRRRCSTRRRSRTTTRTRAVSRARWRCCDAVSARPGHAASYELCRVAVAAERGRRADGRLPGGRAATGSRAASSRSRCRAAAVALAGHAPASAGRRQRRRTRRADAYYVDALAVTPGLRRRGVARRCWTARGRAARRGRPRRLALDTGLHNESRARAVRGVRLPPARGPPGARARAGAALGGPGFVGYLKAL